MKFKKSLKNGETHLKSEKFTKKKFKVTLKQLNKDLFTFTM